MLFEEKRSQTLNIDENVLQLRSHASSTDTAMYRRQRALITGHFNEDYLQGRLCGRVACTNDKRTRRRRRRL